MRSKTPPSLPQSGIPWMGTTRPLMRKCPMSHERHKTSQLVGARCAHLWNPSSQCCLAAFEHRISSSALPPTASFTISQPSRCRRLQGRRTFLDRLREPQTPKSGTRTTHPYQPLSGTAGQSVSQTSINDDATFLPKTANAPLPLPAPAYDEHACWSSGRGVG